MRRALLGMALYAATIAAFHVVVGRSVEQLASRDGAHYAGDFAYHQRMARAFWFGEHRHVYRLAEQRAVLAEIFGAPVEQAMPIGAWPTFLVILLPFSWIGVRSASLAYDVWMGSSLLLFAVVMGRQAARSPLARRRPDLALLVAAPVLVSDATARAVLLGQTSVAATALLVLLYADARALARETWRRQAIHVLAVLALSFKPPYLLLALATLALHRRWRTAGAALLVVAAVTLALSLRLGSAWPADYLATMRSYTGAAPIPEYRDSLSVHTMNVFRYAFTGRLGADAARRWSSAMAAGAIIAWLLAAAACLRRELRAPDRAAALVCALCAILLLFPPYSGAYEDLLIALPLVVAAKERGGAEPSLAGALALAVGLVVVLDFALLRPWVPPEASWLVKASLLATLAWKAAPDAVAAASGARTLEAEPVRPSAAGS